MVKRNIIFSCVGIFLLLMGSCQKPEEGKSPKTGNSANDQTSGQEYGKGKQNAVSSSRKGPPKTVS